jgi:hypothetical protein
MAGLFTTQEFIAVKSNDMSATFAVVEFRRFLLQANSFFYAMIYPSALPNIENQIQKAFPVTEVTISINPY